jgi:hypothetical protein
MILIVDRWLATPVMHLALLGLWCKIDQPIQLE